MALRFTLRQLEYFVATGEAGSIAAAAERTHVSPPSISAALRALEDELGVALFIRRHAHGLSLTPSGRQLLAEAKRTLAAAEGLTALASDIGEAATGPLALGCLQTFAPLVLPELRQGFEAAYPSVRVTQYALDHSDLLERLLTGALDLALTYDLAVPHEIDFEPLTSLTPWVLLPAAHPLAARPSLTPEDLAAEPMVLLDLPYSADYFLSLFGAAGRRPRIAERSRDMALVRALVANGYGFSLINTRTAQDQAPDGKRLAFVPLASGLRPLALGLAAPRGGFARRTPAAFRDHCRAAIAATGLPGCLPAP
jgi:DNA-binding transcriptional LysR family regulator